jgi:hypothetical protein
MARHSFAPLALSAAFFFAGCASKKREHPAPGASAIAGPRRVGTVAVVNADLRFVLVDVGSQYTPPAGMALKSFSGSAETGILAVSPEKQRPFIAADIIKGEPKVGDVVEE